MVLATIGTGAYDVCRTCNRGYMQMEEIQRYLYPRLYLPPSRSISYPSEDNYIEERAEKEQQSINKNNRNNNPVHHSLCETVLHFVTLNDFEYEYQPRRYLEIYCKNNNYLDNIDGSVDLLEQNCTRSGYDCVQRKKQVLLMRRRWRTDCWEPVTKSFASGCECMWSEYS